MPSIHELTESNYLKKEDCGSGIIVTIASVSRKNLAKEGEKAEFRFLLHFEEDLKPMVLNSTNGQTIAELVGDEEMDNWTGGQICLYNDPSISFGGKRMGGIRVRAAQEKPAPAPKRAPQRQAPSAAEPMVPADQDGNDPDINF